MKSQKPKKQQQKNGHSSKLFLSEKKVCKNCKRVHGLVSGKVQGVFFRAHAQKWATESGLKGWVKNTPDESVEFTAEGNEKKLKEFIEKIRKGSPASVVNKVDVSWSETENEFREFRIIY